MRPQISIWGLVRPAVGPSRVFCARKSSENVWESQDRVWKLSRHYWMAKERRANNLQKTRWAMFLKQSVTNTLQSNLANLSLQFYLPPFLRTHLCSNKLVSTFSLFLDASTHLYMRLCPSVCLSIRPSVRQAFLKYRGNGDFKTIKHQGTHRNEF